MQGVRNTKREWPEHFLLNGCGARRGSGWPSPPVPGACRRGMTGGALDKGPRLLAVEISITGLHDALGKIKIGGMELITRFHSAGTPLGNVRLISSELRRLVPSALT